MDLEQLTKHQIILLTLLVSFVTSIATGIVTVSLMNQMPVSVTKTINQIVERTVEKVTPGDTAPAKVVMSDEDMRAQSVASVQKSIIRITVRGKDELVTRGVIVDSKGRALTDNASLVATGETAFDAILANGVRVPIANTYRLATTSALAIAEVSVGTSTGFAPATLVGIDHLRLGQSVLRIGGKGVDSVADGVVSMLPALGDTSPMITASVTSVIPGSLLITLSGEVVGMATSQSLEEGVAVYTPLARIPASATKAVPKP